DEKEMLNQKRKEDYFVEKSKKEELMKQKAESDQSRLQQYQRKADDLYQITRSAAESKEISKQRVIIETAKENEKEAKAFIDKRENCEKELQRMLREEQEILDRIKTKREERLGMQQTIRGFQRGNFSPSMAASWRSSRTQQNTIRKPRGPSGSGTRAGSPASRPPRPKK
ncbi:MAG: hypothetical protein EZS28_039561, partial [Streblomastix strix]